MSKGYMEEIRRRIQTAEGGSVFVTSDFADVANPATIRKSLYDLVHKGDLTRILDGVFLKPEYNEFIGGFVAEDPDTVAKAIARGFRWTIFPSGNTALNILGLSEQVPAAHVYLSDGPYRTYDLGWTKIEFRHRANKEISGMSNATALVVQAIKTLGKEHIDEDVTKRISQRFSKNEKSTMLAEAKGTTGWVYNEIKRICKLTEGVL